MTDDSLDDVNTKDKDMKTEKEVMDEKQRLNKLYEPSDILKGIDLKRFDQSVYGKEIWNAAIEAAALIADETDKDYHDNAAPNIRKLKK